MNYVFKKILILFLGAVIPFLGSCSKSSLESENFVRIGSYAATYNPETGEVTYELLSSSQSKEPTSSTSLYALDYNDTTGVTNPDPGQNEGAIRDTSKSSGDINYEMGLVDPDSCSTNYNSTTKVLSFYAKIVNKSNLPNDGSPYTYRDVADFPPNTTFYAPFYYKITGLDWDTVTYPQLINAVNTNIPGSECGSSGLTLANDDQDNNKRFDCIWPDQAYSLTDDKDPGWNFTPYVTSNDMTPGEDTGCVLFMQYTLEENASFTIFFDLLGVKDDGALPSAPTVTSPSTPSYSNSSPINVTGTCTAGSTVTVEGGNASILPYPRTTTCTGGGTYSVSVDLNLNTVNNLIVYQIVASKQSPAVSLEITHDNIAPTIVASVPADGETGVDRNTNCTLTFSESMDATTFASGTNCTNGTFRICRGGTFLAGSISNSSDTTQFVYTPNTKPLNANSSHDCKVTTGVTDLAGNAIAANYTATFTTTGSSSEFTDTIPPAVRSTFPADNATIVPNSNFAITYFNEAMDGSTLDVVDSSCSNNLENVSVIEFPNCGCPLNNITDTTTLNAAGDIATTTLTSTLDSNDCYAFIVQGCVEDLAGNQLPTRANFTACGTSTLAYNILNIFFVSSTADSTGPSVVHVGPVGAITNVLQPIFPFFVFSEPLHPNTIITDYFFLNKFGETDKIPLSLQKDPSLQLATLQPNSPLDTTTTATHVMTVTGAVTDLTGNLMTAPQTSSFDVTSTADTTPPTVVSVTPSNPIVPAPGNCGAAGNYISKCSTFDVRFSEPIDVTTLSTANVELIEVAGSPCASTLKKPVSLDVADDGMSVTLTPVSSMRSGGACGGDRRRYYVQIDNIKDRAGNAIASAYQSIIYSACKETQVPSVTAIVPPDGGTISQNGNFAVFFSEPMDKSTLTTANINISTCPPTVVFASEDGLSAVVNCPFNISASGTLTIDRASRDYYVGGNNQSCEQGSGNQMAADVTSDFIVGATDSTAPTVSALGDVNPQDGSTSVATTIAPSITFNEAIDPRTVTSTSVFLTDQEGNIIDSRLSLSANARTVTITPISSLSSPGIYYIIATTAIRDLGGANPYDGDGGENSSVPNVLRTCFSTSAAACP